MDGMNRKRFRHGKGELNITLQNCVRVNLHVK